MNMVDPSKEREQAQTATQATAPIQTSTETVNRAPAPAQSASEAASYTPIKDEVSAVNGFHYIDELPSKYKLYPDDTKIYARPLKVLEIKTLSTINENNINSVINSVLSKTIKGIDVGDLLVADKLYLIFWLRANTYKDSGFVVDFDCTSCQEDSTYEFEINNLDVEEIKDDYDPEKAVTLQYSGDSIKWSQIRVKDENNVKDFVAKHRNSMMKFDDEVLGVANLITTINGEKKSMLQKYEYLVAMSPLDYTYLESYIRNYELGINPVMNVKCAKCGGISPVAVSFRRSFFIPRAVIN